MLREPCNVRGTGRVVANIRPEIFLFSFYFFAGARRGIVMRGCKESAEDVSLRHKRNGVSKPSTYWASSQWPFVYQRMISFYCVILQNDSFSKKWI